ncbi:c-type cytochrome [Thiolapillus sp.]|uniref:Cytochrome c4 n=5 Tax=Thiolapillus TaxID=1608298 RepID=A0A831WC56_9GAMM|nr:cytochrome c4 [Thiolapillus brandeum]
MKKIILALGLLSIGTANAANIDLAKSIVKAKCHLCHGEEGEASSAIYPRLAGQNRNYLVKQLKNFRDGKRKSDTMNEMAKDLKDDQIEALADYFSSKPALTHRVRDKGFAAVGEYLFKKGNRYSGIPACKSCHGEFGQGTDELPRLAGQHKRYVADQLQAFGERARTNDNAIMHTIASKLTEMEIEALALYVSGIKEETKEEQ